MTSTVAYAANTRMTRIIKEIASRQGVTEAEAVRRAILFMQYLSKRAAAGDTITVRDLNTGESIELNLSTTP